MSFNYSEVLGNFLMNDSPLFYIFIFFVSATVVSFSIDVFSKKLNLWRLTLCSGIASFLCFAGTVVNFIRLMCNAIASLPADQKKITLNSLLDKLNGLSFFAIVLFVLLTVAIVRNFTISRRKKESCHAG